MSSFVLKNDYGQYSLFTMGLWDTGSWIGGEDYPASGEDFVLQTASKSLSRKKDEMVAMYTKAKTNDEAVEGDSYYGTYQEEFWRSDGNDEYIEYTIKDDPFGMHRLAVFYSLPLIIIKTIQEATECSTATMSIPGRVWIWTSP